MTSELSKTISTCTIWIATAIILTFGVFKTSGDILYFVAVTGLISATALGATYYVWDSDKSPAGAAPTTEPPKG